MLKVRREENDLLNAVKDARRLGKEDAAAQEDLEEVKMEETKDEEEALIQPTSSIN